MQRKSKLFFRFSKCNKIRANFFSDLAKHSIIDLMSTTIKIFLTCQGYQYYNVCVGSINVCIGSYRKSMYREICIHFTRPYKAIAEPLQSPSEGTGRLLAWKLACLTLSNKTVLSATISNKTTTFVRGNAMKKLRRVPSTKKNLQWVSQGISILCVKGYLTLQRNRVIWAHAQWGLGVIGPVTYTARGRGLGGGWGGLARAHLPARPKESGLRIAPWPEERLQMRALYSFTVFTVYILACGCNSCLHRSRQCNSCLHRSRQCNSCLHRSRQCNSCLHRSR